MPIFRAAGKLLYFAHVPKCGGSSVEAHLRERFGAPAFLDQDFFSVPERQRWSRSSPQHIPAAALERLFPADFFDAAFAVVRHPVDRLVSAFHFLQEARFVLGAATGFSEWIAHLEHARAKDPWLHDSHLRPMVEFVPQGAKVFHLENGLEPVGGYLDALFGAAPARVGFGREQERKATTPRVSPSPQDLATIERLYAADYERFGYDRQAVPVLFAARPGPKGEAAPKTAPSDPDRALLAERLRERGNALFKSGDIAGAHANFRLALNCLPEDAGLHAMIAGTALRLDALHLATDHAMRALAVQPENLDARLALAGARLRLKHPAAREAVQSLMAEEGLGDFRRLLAVALSANEGEAPETTLMDLADYMESHPRDPLASELVPQALSALQSLEDKARCDDFLAGVGVLPEGAAAINLSKPAVGQPGSVDIIIPVYNAVDDLEGCLASLRRWPSALLARIILVDDCSTVETAQWLAAYKDRHSDVTVVRTPANLGFTRAVTTGVAQSTAPFMLFLNSDTVVTPDWLDGMMQAILSDPQAALAGPFSDDGYHQTIRAAAAPGAKSEPAPSPEDAAALVRAATRRVYPRVPLLSGFCLLVHRGAYDAVGGLDAEAFPHGYGEVQDLCLRLNDIGCASLIADSVFVHHKGGASIMSQRKTDLIQAGFVQLYRRHSPLRLLVAEAISASEPEIANHQRFWTQRSELAATSAGMAPDAVVPVCLTGEMARRPVIAPQDRFEGREVCLFVAHAPKGAVQDYTLTYLSELRRSGVAVILCLAVEDLFIPVDARLTGCVEGIILRENGGFDFGAWADVLRDLPQIWRAERLYFLNDSLLGPFGSMDQIFARIRAENAGFFAMTECSLIRPHAQSFFFGWNRQNLQSRRLRTFWAEVRNLVNKEDVIHAYELNIAALSDDLPDPTRQTLIGFAEAYGCTAEDLPNFSISHHGWKRVLALGIPFVKTNLLREGIVATDTTGWEEFCAAHGADIAAMQRSIEMSRLNRL